MSSEKVNAKLESIPRSQEIPATETCHQFPVLVRFTAPEWWHGVPTRHAGIDVVAVLNTRSTMPWERLELIKQAMMMVVSKLGPEDRLSMVSFGTNVHRLTELTYMSDHGRVAAKLKVGQLESKRSYWTESKKPAGALLREGDLILRGREAEGSSLRVGCMMFLSAGDCREVVVEHAHASNFPVYTIGLGANHDPKHMEHIADTTSGTYYSLIDCQEKGMINLMAGLLLPIAARSVKITVRAHEGVSISSIASGGYGNRVSRDKLSGEIDMSNIYAGEQKKFMVHLSVAKGEQGKLVTVGGYYQGLKKLPESDVEVQRKKPRGWTWTVIHHLVASELVRLRLEKAVRAMVEEEEEAARGDGLQQLWDEIKGSVEGCYAGEMALCALQKDVAKLKKSGLPYMLSWLSCHKWQRPCLVHDPQQKISQGNPLSGTTYVFGGQQPKISQGNPLSGTTYVFGGQQPKISHGNLLSGYTSVFGRQQPKISHGSHVSGNTSVFDGQQPKISHGTTSFVGGSQKKISHGIPSVFGGQQPKISQGITSGTLSVVCGSQKKISHDVPSVFGGQQPKISHGTTSFVGGSQKKISHGIPSVFGGQQPKISQGTTSGTLSVVCGSQKKISHDVPSVFGGLQPKISHGTTAGTPSVVRGSQKKISHGVPSVFGGQQPKISHSTTSSTPSVLRGSQKKNSHGIPSVFGGQFKNDLRFAGNKK